MKQINTKIWFLLMLSTLMLVTSGCLKEEEEIIADDNANPVIVNPRDALLNALDKQSENLVTGINKAVIEGNFLKNLTLENPPHAIPLTSDNDIQKFLHYLLANQKQVGLNTVYSPDSRICSEVMAVNDPALCIEVMKLVSLNQAPASDDEGSVEIKVGSARPFSLYYSKNEIVARSSVTEIIKMLKEADVVFVKNGHQGFGTFPTIFEGAIELSIKSILSVSVVRLGVTTPIDVQGTNAEGRNYAVQISPAFKVIEVTLESLTGLATADLAIPTITASIPVYDDQVISHQVDVIFPGLAGLVKVDNNLEKLFFQKLKFNSTDAFISVDGQTAAHLHTSAELNGFIHAKNDGSKLLNFANSMTAQIQIFQNPVLQGQGQLAFEIGENTELEFAPQTDYGKITAGYIKFLGDGDFLGALDAQANTCILATNQAGFPLQTARCN